MHFRKFHIFLLVLVFSLDYVRTDEDYDAAVDDEADLRVEDDDDADDDDEVADDAVADDAVADDAVADYAVADDAEADDEAIVEAESVNAIDKPSLDFKGAECAQGTHFKDDCNICFCYKSNVQACTNTDCRKQTMKTLSGNPAKRLAFKKLRAEATGCVPGEKIRQNNCECNCAIPSVLTCPEKCL